MEPDLDGRSLLGAGGRSRGISPMNPRREFGSGGAAAARACQAAEAAGQRRRPARPTALRRSVSAEKSAAVPGRAGRTVGGASLRTSGAAQNLFRSGSSQALEELKYGEPLTLREMVAERVAGVEHSRVHLRIRGIDFHMCDRRKRLAEGLPLLS